MKEISVEKFIFNHENMPLVFSGEEKNINYPDHGGNHSAYFFNNDFYEVVSYDTADGPSFSEIKNKILLKIRSIDDHTIYCFLSSIGFAAVGIGFACGTVPAVLIAVGSLLFAKCILEHKRSLRHRDYVNNDSMPSPGWVQRYYHTPVSEYGISAFSSNIRQAFVHHVLFNKNFLKYKKLNYHEAKDKINYACKLKHSVDKTTNYFLPFIQWIKIISGEMRMGLDYLKAVNYFFKLKTKCEDRNFGSMFSPDDKELNKSICNVLEMIYQSNDNNPTSIKDSSSLKKSNIKIESFFEFLMNLYKNDGDSLKKCVVNNRKESSFSKTKVLKSSVPDGKKYSSPAVKKLVDDNFEKLNNPDIFQAAKNRLAHGFSKRTNAENLSLFVGESLSMIGTFQCSINTVLFQGIKHTHSYFGEYLWERVLGNKEKEKVPVKKELAEGIIEHVAAPVFILDGIDFRKFNMLYDFNDNYRDLGKKIENFVNDIALNWFNFNQSCKKIIDNIKNEISYDYSSKLNKTAEFLIKAFLGLQEVALVAKYLATKSLENHEITRHAFAEIKNYRLS